MRIEDVRLGMKVVPHSKSIGIDYVGCEALQIAKERKQPYLYVAKINDDSVVLSEDFNGIGNLYVAEDFEPYIETYAQHTVQGWRLMTFLVPKNTPEIKRIVFNNPATIVFWQDCTKSVAMVGQGEAFDESTGVAVCYMKKIFGNWKQFEKVIKEKGI